MKENRNLEEKKSVAVGKRSLLVGLLGLLALPQLKKKIVFKRASGSVARSSSHQGVKSA